MKEQLPGELETHRSGVYRICYCVLRHAQDAEDAAQEALLQAARQERSLRDRERLEAWLHRVALHAALDALRRRRTRARHEGLTPAPAARESDSRVEALYSALAGLSDDERRLLVEHFLEKKSFREMAAAKKCSEVAVWKRTNRAKRRLRDALIAGGAGAALLIMGSEGFGRSSLPISAGRAILLGAAAAVVIGAGVIRAQWGSPGVPPDAAALPGRTALAPAPFPPSTTAVAVSVLPTAAPRVRPAERRPYPYQFPPPGWNPALTSTWRALRETRVTELHLQDVGLDTFASEVSLQTGVRITLAPGLEAHRISFMLRDIALDGTLRLALGPRRLGFELVDDGSLRIGAEERLTRSLERDARRIEQVLSALEDVRRRLDKGWNGRDQQSADEALAERIRTTRIISRQSDGTPEEMLAHLREASGVNILLDAASGAAALSPLADPFLFPILHGTVQEHLDRVCAEFGLGHTVTDNVVLVTTRERATESQRRQEEERAQRKEIQARLQRRTPAGLPSTMPDLVAALERALELEVLVTKRVWDCDAEIVIPEGIPIGTALDDLAAQHGFRWALDRSLYILD